MEKIGDLTPCCACYVWIQIQSVSLGTSISSWPELAEIWRRVPEMGCLPSWPCQWPCGLGKFHNHLYKLKGWSQNASKHICLLLWCSPGKRAWARAWSCKEQMWDSIWLSSTGRRGVVDMIPLKYSVVEVGVVYTGGLFSWFFIFLHNSIFQLLWGNSAELIWEPVQASYKYSHLPTTQQTFSTVISVIFSPTFSSLKMDKSEEE